jgi:hypothetical protein
MYAALGFRTRIDTCDVPAGWHEAFHDSAAHFLTTALVMGKVRHDTSALKYRV